MRIFVDTQEEKQKLLEASKHIHDADIDTSIEMVNEIAHLYLSSDQIEVDGRCTFQGKELEVLGRIISHYSTSGNSSGDLIREVGLEGEEAKALLTKLWLVCRAS